MGIEEHDIKKLTEEELEIKRADTINYYMLLQNVYDLFTSGRRISAAIIIWYKPEEKKDEK